MGAADRAVEIESFDQLASITSKTPGFTETCEALEQAVGANGLVLDLDCD